MTAARAARPRCNLALTVPTGDSRTVRDLLDAQPDQMVQHHRVALRLAEVAQRSNEQRVVLARGG